MTKERPVKIIKTMLFGIANQQESSTPDCILATLYYDLRKPHYSSFLSGAYTMKVQKVRRKSSDGVYTLDTYRMPPIEETIKYVGHRGSKGDREAIEKFDREITTFIKKSFNDISLSNMIEQDETLRDASDVAVW